VHDGCWYLGHEQVLLCCWEVPHLFSCLILADNKLIWWINDVMSFLYE
jgi:hypothetical protein